MISEASLPQCYLSTKQTELDSDVINAGAKFVADKTVVTDGCLVTTPACATRMATDITNWAH